MIEITGLQSKTAVELLNAFKVYQNQVENQIERSIKWFRSDRGGEFQKEFGQFLSTRGIIYKVTASYSPKQNGISECTNCTISEGAKAILVDTGLPKTLWLEIANTIIYLKNWTSNKAIDGPTLYKAWHGSKPDLSHLRTIGCDAYVHILK
jgi:transposase InsO family protein